MTLSNCVIATSTDSLPTWLKVGLLVLVLPLYLFKADNEVMCFCRLVWKHRGITWWGSIWSCYYISSQSHQQRICCQGNHKNINSNIAGCKVLFDGPLVDWAWRGVTWGKQASLVNHIIFACMKFLRFSKLDKVMKLNTRENSVCPLKGCQILVEHWENAKLQCSKKIYIPEL